MPAHKQQRVSRDMDKNKKTEVIRNTPCELVKLPTEILGLILDDVLSLSDFLDTATFEDAIISEILGHNVLATCKSIRSQGLEMIMNRCVWIRIGCSMYGAWKALQKHVIHAAVTPGWRQILDKESLQTIDLFIGLGHATAVGSQCITLPRQSVLMAFSYHIWLGFLTQLQIVGYSINPPSSNHLELRCVKSNSNIERVLKSHILPLFRNVCSLYKFTFVGERLHNSSDMQSLASPMATGGSGTRYMASNDAKALARRVSTLYADGYNGEGDITALYGGLIFDLFSSTFASDDEGSTLKERIRTVIDVGKLGSKAASILTKLFKFKGVEWFQRNETIVECARGWVGALLNMAYFLRYDRRGQLHHAVSELVEVIAKIDVGLCYEDDDDELLENDEEYQRSIRTSEIHREVAVKLLEDPAFELQSRVKDSKFDHGSDFEGSQYVTLHNLQDSGFCWAGDKTILRIWGDAGELRHLPSLRDCVGASSSDEGIGGVESEPELRHCGGSCNCILY